MEKKGIIKTVGIVVIVLLLNFGGAILLGVYYLYDYDNLTNNSEKTEVPLNKDNVAKTWRFTEKIVYEYQLEELVNTTEVDISNSNMEFKSDWSFSENSLQNNKIVSTIGDWLIEGNNIILIDENKVERIFEVTYFTNTYMNGSILTTNEEGRVTIQDIKFEVQK